MGVSKFKFTSVRKLRHSRSEGLRKRGGFLIRPLSLHGSVGCGPFQVSQTLYTVSKLAIHQVLTLHEGERNVGLAETRRLENERDEKGAQTRVTVETTCEEGGTARLLFHLASWW